MLCFLLTITDDSSREMIIRIYKTFHDDMIRFAKSRLKNAGSPNYAIDAEDAVQNAFLKLTKYAGSISANTPDRELRACVFSIVSNEVSDILAGDTDFDDIDDHTDEIDDDEFCASLAVNERYEEVVAAIRSLDEKYSITLLYRFQKEMTVAEIAGLMGLSEKTVYTRIERGKKLLLDALEISKN